MTWAIVITSFIEPKKSFIVSRVNLLSIAVVELLMKYAASDIINELDRIANFVLPRFSGFG